MPNRLRYSDSSSDFSIEVVPTRIGRPSAWTSLISSRIAGVLLALVAEDHVGVVPPGERPVGRDGDHVQAVDLVELGRLGHGRAGHARQLLVELEEVLQGDGGQRLVLFLDLDPFLGLDGLVQPVGPLAADHQPAGELVDDDHLAVGLDHVVAVAAVEVMGLQGVVDQVGPFHVAGRVEALDPGDLLGLADALVVQVAGPLLLLDLEVEVALELAGDPVGLGILPDVVERRPGDDQRRPGLVDQDAVHLVDDRVVELALALILLGRLHVVAEVVEAELVVGAVGDVAAVHLLPLGRFHLRLDRPDGHSQPAEERAHPLGVAAGQVVVDRDDVHALAVQRVEIGGQGGDQRLALAGDHLGDVAAVQDHPAHELHVEVPHVEEPPARLAAGRERLGQQVVERSPPRPGGGGTRRSSPSAAHPRAPASRARAR